MGEVPFLFFVFRLFSHYFFFYSILSFSLSLFFSLFSNQWKIHFLSRPLVFPLFVDQINFKIFFLSLRLHPNTSTHITIFEKIRLSIHITSILQAIIIMFGIGKKSSFNSSMTTIYVFLFLVINQFLIVHSFRLMSNDVDQVNTLFVL